MLKFRWLVVVGLVLALALTLRPAPAQAATGIGPCAPLSWDDAGNVYDLIFGADTAFGESVFIQYTLDGTPLTGDNGTTPGTGSWNGTVAACSANVTLAPCGSGTRWDCEIPETNLASITYRAVVANEPGNGTQWYGLQSGDLFSTGPNAVVLAQANGGVATSPWLLLAGVLGLGAAGALAWRRSR